MRKTIIWKTPITLSALALSSVMLLAACEQERLNPPKPIVDAGASSTLGTTGSAADASVPRADSVFSPTESLPKAAPTAPAANTAATATAPTRSKSTMSRVEESASMPMVGQNNDHSAPAAARSTSRGVTGTSSSASTPAKP